MIKHLAALALLASALVISSGCQSAPQPIKEKNSLDPTRALFQLPGESVMTINDVTVATLENGLTLVHKKRAANSIVGFSVYIRGGAAEDAATQSGLSSLMMNVMMKGTQTRDSQEIAEELGMLGTSIGSNASQDYCRLSMQCVKNDLPSAMELFIDILRNPRFDLDQTELEQKKVLASIRMRDDRTSSLTFRRFLEEVYGKHPYGRATEGESDTVTELLPVHLHARHDLYFVPSNMIFTVVGNIEFDKVKSLVKKHLGEVALEKETRYKVNKIIAPDTTRVELSKASEQGFVVMGHQTCGLKDSDRYAIEVTSNILGGGMSSRLFSELRDKRSLAYAVGAFARFYEDKGFFATYIGTAPANLAEDENNPGQSIVESALWGQIEQIMKEPVRDDELERAKNYIAGNFLSSQERNADYANMLGYWYMTDRGVDYGEKYVEQIKTVTTRDVMRVANKYLLDPTVVVLRPQ